MGKQSADSNKTEKPPKPAKSAPSGEAAGKTKEPKEKDKEKKAKAEASADKEKEAGKEKEKPKPPPRPPADPRLKVLKKFYGKFLPRGPLRDRYKALMTRWNSGEDHGGVTVDDLKSLYQDWKAPVKVKG